MHGAALRALVQLPVRCKPQAKLRAIRGSIALQTSDSPSSRASPRSEPANLLFGTRLLHFACACEFCLQDPEILPPGNFAWFSSVLVKLAVQHPQDAQISHLLLYSGSMLAPDLDVLCGPRRRSFRLSLHIPTLPQN